MSKHTELSEYIITLAAREFDVCKEDIVSGNRHTETVDARHVVIKLLYQQGFYPGRIASILNQSPRTITYAITNFDSRIKMNPLMNHSYVIIAQLLRNYLDITGK